MDLDQITAVRKQHGKSIPLDFFSREMYSQPSLGRRRPVVPAPYRAKKPVTRIERRNSDEEGVGSSSGSRRASASKVIVGKSQLGIGRQSLGGGGMYAYDDADDEEDNNDKAKQWEAEAEAEGEGGVVSPSILGRRGSNKSHISPPDTPKEESLNSPKIVSYGSINDPNK